MKKYLYTPLLAVFLSLPAIAQQNPQRSIQFKTYGADSIRLTFNKEYYLIEDSCAQITRYTRFNFQTKKYLGEFKDVSSTNPSFVISKGNYNEAGQKNGEFTEYYLNGNLMAKGAFKNNKYTGKWETYFEDGQPKLTFEMTDSTMRIIDAWDDKHKKTVDNGNGTYEIAFFYYKWTGKIVKGRPDGTWLYVSSRNKDEEPIRQERFYEGQFSSGKDFSGTYTDSSRIVFVNDYLLPLVNAETLKISPVGCTAPVVFTAKIISAQYGYGNDDFSDQIKQVAGDYISRMRGHGDITITGIVNEKGALTDLKSKYSYSADINSKDLIVALEKLPLLNPATVNGKPVKQGFSITFKINGSLYSFSYSFLQINPSEISKP